MEDEKNIVELIDDNDESFSFEHLMTLDYEGKEYIVLMPLAQSDETDGEEVVILRVELDENGEDIYTSIHDMEEMDEVFDAFKEIISENP